jgi:hypothetical protein
MMNTRVTLALTLSLAVLLPGCGGKETASAPAATATTGAQASTSVVAALTPEQLGELGAQLSKNPDRADQLLEQQGLNRDSFEKAVREVTENVDASKRYAAAFRRAAA